MHTQMRARCTHAPFRAPATHARTHTRAHTHTGTHARTRAHIRARAHTHTHTQHLGELEEFLAITEHVKNIRQQHIMKQVAHLLRVCRNRWWVVGRQAGRERGRKERGTEEGWGGGGVIFMLT